MELKKDQQLQQTKPNKTLNDPKEVERILMRYAGIFKKQIPMFAATVIKKNKPIKNYSR